MENRSSQQVAAFRLARHHLTTATRARLVEVCGDVCGIQAQIMGAARLALWTRKHDLTRKDIDFALYEARALVKTSCMRQTLHLLPSSEFSTYIAALRRSRLEAIHRVTSRFGIEQKEIDRLNECVLEALDGAPVAQRDLTERIRPRVSRNVRAWMDKVWSPFKPALAEGLICYGPETRGQANFVRVDRWLAAQQAVPEQEAKQALLRRYLSAYGPARLQDFSHWSGISVREARPIWDALRDELSEVTIGDGKSWILRKDRRHLFEAPCAKMLRLLPSFDPYLLGHAQKDHLLKDHHYKKVFRNQGWISPVVLLDGRVIGTWSEVKNGAEHVVRIEAFEKLSKATRRIEEEAASLGVFVGVPCRIDYAT